jgi:hypothetical protein
MSAPRRESACAHPFDHISQPFGAPLKHQFMEDVSPFEANCQTRVPADQLAREWSREYADVAAERPEHGHVVALTAKGVERMGRPIGRNRLQISAQLRKVVFLYMLAERIDLSHEGACDVPPGAMQLLTFLETVRDEACNADDPPAIAPEICTHGRLIISFQRAVSAGRS